MAQQSYYKATRPDGTDFHIGVVQYEVGKTVRPLPHRGQPRLCGPGYLHVSETPGETLIGGRWPCRLFEVQGKVAAGFSDQHLHKGGMKRLKVVRELPAHLALGPNGQYVVGVIERTRAITYAEATELRAARHAAWGAARGAVWDAALAYLTRDLIADRQFKLLAGPWIKVLGEVVVP